MMPRIPLIGMPTYGLFVALGFVAFLLLAWRLAPRYGLSQHAVQDVLVWASLWGILGAKILLIAVEPGEFIAAPWSILFQGGVFYGGLIGGVLAGWFRARRLGLDPWALADVVAPCLALAHAFGRVGCFFAGCCYGAPCEAPWALHFHDPLSAPMLSGISPTQGLHPTQLYEVVGILGIVVLLLALLPRRAFLGQVWWTYVAAYAALRFVIEMYRGDGRGTLGGISTSQAIALVGLASSVVGLLVLRRRIQPERLSAEPPGP